MSLTLRIRKIYADLSDCPDLIVKIDEKVNVSELRKKISAKWRIRMSNQKIYYQGKELVDEHKLCDYGIQNEHVLLLMKHQVQINKKNSGKENNLNQDNHCSESFMRATTSKFYQTGDFVDVRIDNAWFECKIVEILCESSSSIDDEDSKHFTCKLLRNDYEIEKTTISNIRPRSFYTFKRNELKKNMRVLANVNLDEPYTRGNWYDFEILEISKDEILGLVFMEIPIECAVHLIRELMRIEEPTLLTERKENLDAEKLILRKYPLVCFSCYDNRGKLCKDCGCDVCGGKTNTNLMLMCEECGTYSHLNCLNPPLKAIPEGDWFCVDCKNNPDEIIKPGESLQKIKNKPLKVNENVGKIRFKRRYIEDTTFNYKKQRVAFSLNLDILIISDEINHKLWRECLGELINKGIAEFYEKIEEIFMCVCCQDLLNEPVTLDCSHNFCRACILRSFNVGIFKCPNCRLEINDQYNSIRVNSNLNLILNELYQSAP